MKLLGIVLVFLSFVFCGIAASKKYLSLTEGIEKAEKLINTIIDGILNDRSTMEEILQRVKVMDEKTDVFIDAVLKNSEGKRIMLKKEIASETGFCSDDYTNKLLQEAFDIFGKTTAEEQISRLKHIRGGIITRREELLQPSLQKAKLSRSFGIIAGLLAAVILL